ncbi:tRNA uridine-5-carboxymethylaminomethyl(34) synthesis GTPase MnmE [Pseudozobellia sp. WGM2]|uniref:tRNA uridine-5-carboxymethylaminomethyl(34) synthesis GTPase MnmE n=1 Tax=Pseudozobellia sp. WGM2 TaxID=2787625 RepID=UPI001AE0805B|nr:tRNA uridine-5-carboxymethylaminomethyl(34) synthesis GTPase MnmE [Pseudozobellia sp. WGM2]
MISNDTIIALATPSGAGAIAVIRVSGLDAIPLVAPLFKSAFGKNLNDQPTHSIRLGHIIDGGKILDEVLVSLFKGPNSYTGEDVVEISCHGSPYIQQQIIQLFLRNGCRTAEPGEFTLRAFLNGKMDLSQAEAVADLISSDNAASHEIAIQQMRGGFSHEIKELRTELLNFASLIELELDFSEEDVEFADRTQFKELLVRIREVLRRLIDSFAVGNVIKNGIPVAIVGEPNVGKSTLLNALLNEERALVSDIAGTTRDTIEDEIAIGGIGFRFIDTAGIRETKDVVEGMGIQRTYEKIEKSQVTLYLIDSLAVLQSQERSEALLQSLKKIKNTHPHKPVVVIANKIDCLEVDQQLTLTNLLEEIEGITIQMLSAKTKEGVEELKKVLLSFMNTGALRNNETIVTNTRHYSSLVRALEEIEKIQLGMDENLSSDLLSIDVREALYHLGEITGQVTNDELLGNIFANFCIGK